VNLPHIVASVTIALLMLYNREFVKFRIGPFFALEWSLLLIVLTSLATQKRVLWIHSLGPLRPFLLFFAWGMIRLILEFFSPESDASVILSKETLQNCIFFVYPLIWCSAGFVLIEISTAWIRKTAFLALGLATVSHLFLPQTNPLNLPFFTLYPIVLGPLAIIPAIDQLVKISDKKGSIPLCAGLFVLACLPFWKMWITYMQRTYLLELLGLMVLVPLALREALRSRFQKILAFGAPLLILAAGFLAASAWKGSMDIDRGTVDPGQDFMTSFNHHDDVDRDTPGYFQARTRRIMWTSAFEQWRSHPLAGIGMSTPVPKYIGQTCLTGRSPTDCDNTLIENGYHKDQGVTKIIPPVTGPHNSWLGALARLGIVGLALLLWGCFSWTKRACRLVTLPTTPSMDKLVILAVPVCGFIYATLNVGFESPYNSFALWFFAGMLFSDRMLDS